MSLLEMEKLSFCYDQKNPILQNIFFRADNGESIGIVGANGVGKSTLLKLLVGLHFADSGKVCIDGLQMKKENLITIRKKIGYVFQDSDSQLFMPTVYEDLAFAPRNYGFSEEEVQKKVNYAVEMTGCEHCLDKQIFKLSGGEKKLVSIATVLTLNPEIVILDEPSVSLDPRNRRKLITLLNGLPCLKLIASHDLDMIWETCERTILISGGKIVADGNTKEILTNEELLVHNGLEYPLRAQIERMREKQ